MSDREIRIQRSINLTTQDVANKISIADNISQKAAMRKFKKSITYKILQDTGTGLWESSSPYVYNEYKDEMASRRRRSLLRRFRLVRRRIVR